MILALLLLQSAAASTAPCPATPAPVPAELAGWSPAMLVSATARGDQPLTIGRGATAALRPSAQVRLAAPVGHPPAADTASGVFTFAIATAGRYRVALGAGAWVDVVAGGTALPSVAHAHGTACSPVRKMVDYDLQPGRYRLQIVGSAAPVISLMIARLP